MNYFSHNKLEHLKVEFLNLLINSFFIYFTQIKRKQKKARKTYQNLNLLR